MKQVGIWNEPHATGFIFLDVWYFSQTGYGKGSEFFGMCVVYIDSFVCSNPYKTFSVFIQTTDKITSDAGWIIVVVAVNPEPVSVKAVQAVDGAEPQKAFFILETGDDAIVG